MQYCSLPARQFSHSRHELTMQPTPTRSPGANAVTSEPTSATMPAISWPGIAGYGISPHSPRAKWMSEWQMPQNLMSMRTSLGPIGRRSICSGSRAAVADAAPTALAVVVAEDDGALLISVTNPTMGRGRVLTRTLREGYWQGTPRPRPGAYSWSMGDLSIELAQFLTTRRANVTPEDVGLPVHGRRQVRGLRREEVASLAGVSVEYYKRLERGQATAPSDSVLARARRRRCGSTTPSARTCSTSSTPPARPRHAPCAAAPQQIRPIAQRILDAIDAPVDADQRTR